MSSASQISMAAHVVRPLWGYRLHVDQLDGYSFFYPEDWQLVTTSGNDCFYRNPRDVEETLFVDVSSPSSSRFASVSDLGSPAAAAAKLSQQFLEEFMSTRLGVKRDVEVVAATEREAASGRRYYEVQLRARSYASRNQLAVSSAEVEAGVELEWDRLYTTVLGTAGGRLFSLRLQAPSGKYGAEQEGQQPIVRSFECHEVV